MPLDNFCSTFKNEIINKQALILESMAISTVTNEEEAALAALFLLLKYADKSYLQSINGLVKESDAQWSLESFGVETRLKYERFFSDAAYLIATLINQYSLDPIDLTHFNNISDETGSCVGSLL